MKMKTRVCSLLLCAALAAAPMTAFAAETETISISTGTFSYESTGSFRDTISVPGIDAGLMVTGIYQNKDNPDDRKYTAVALKSHYADRVRLLYWDAVPGGDTVQVGDLISLTNFTIHETEPEQYVCGADTVLTNYGNGSTLLGDEFKKVIRNELKLSQTVYAVGNYNAIGENYQLLPVPPEITGEAPQQLYGDFNGDGIVNASDATVILIYAAEYGAGTFTGTFEEYVNR
ncbi:MAG: hypothetical protein IKN55_04615 [Oscillospiraceae bacterium]|nr:hypothetical protein [Oscillospiraceae bacterium]